MTIPWFYVYIRRYQLWSLDKKMRIMKQAKDYVKKHETEIEERLARSKTFSSYLGQIKLFIIKLFQVYLTIRKANYIIF